MFSPLIHQLASEKTLLVLVGASHLVLVGPPILLGCAIVRGFVQLAQLLGSEPHTIMPRLHFSPLVTFPGPAVCEFFDMNAGLIISQSVNLFPFPRLAPPGI